MKGFVPLLLVLLAVFVANRDAIASDAATASTVDNGAAEQAAGSLQKQLQLRATSTSRCPAIVKCNKMFYLGGRWSIARCTKDEHCWLRGGGRCCEGPDSQRCCVSTSKLAATGSEAGNEEKLDQEKEEKREEEKIVDEGGKEKEKVDGTKEEATSLGDLKKNGNKGGNPEMEEEGAEVVDGEGHEGDKETEAEAEEIQPEHQTGHHDHRDRKEDDEENRERRSLDEGDDVVGGDIDEEQEGNEDEDVEEGDLEDEKDNEVEAAAGVERKSSGADGWKIFGKRGGKKRWRRRCRRCGRRWGDDDFDYWWWDTTTTAAPDGLGTAMFNTMLSLASPRLT